MIDALRLESGLFDRYPEDVKANRDKKCIRHFSRDEQIALLAIDHVFQRELGFSQELYEYGRKHKRLASWHYENRMWRKNGRHVKWVCEHGKKKDGLAATKYGLRTPKFRGLVKAANNASVDALAVAEIVAGLKITGDRPPGKTSGKILVFLRMEILRKANNKLINKALARFENKMYEKYGQNPLHRLMMIYLKHPEHPIRRLAALLE